jgi:hypothetical protein
VSLAMIPTQTSMHSSQMKTVGPAISRRTSCCDLPQNEHLNVSVVTSILLTNYNQPVVFKWRNTIWLSNAMPLSRETCRDGGAVCPYGQRDSSAAAAC